MQTHIVEVINMPREVAWLPWAVQYFFLIGLSVGAFLLSLPGLAFGRSKWRNASRLALLGALVCGLTAPVALLSDLHQPGRFYHFYLYMNATSWMAWGSFFIPLYLGGLMLYAWLVTRPDFQRLADRGGRWAPLYRRVAYGGLSSTGAIRAAAGLTGLGATLVALYTGMEVMVVAARPLWNTPLVPLQLLVTAVAGAIGLVLVLERAMGIVRVADTRLLNQALAASQLAALAVGAIWLALGLFELSPSHVRALAEVSGSPEWRLTAAWAAAATLLTLALALLRSGHGLLTGLLAMHSAWMMRWTLFIGGQEIPKVGAGFHAYHLPLGQDGWLGLFGTAGLWVFVFIALTSLFPWGDARDSQMT
ncbi:MAG: polysulfide reductase NrfD [Zoogloeaceae bacterium]|nr:polysulfide reductase NrfD [Zoogloeaceae bacterium]MCW5617271.1 polysulfide reductase NrfD [Rhodocyclaceae bacterium]